MSRGVARRALAAALALGALLAAGCASVPPYAPPAAGAPAAAPHAASAPRAPAVAPDTTPSRDAQDVLATIPEPLSPGERVPAPESAPVAASADTTAAADSGSAEVPVPAPTPVLGERPLPEVVAPSDTTTPPAAPAPAAVAHPAPAPGTPASAAGDTCWRVQIAAPAEHEKAARYLEAGQSQLLAPLVIVKEKGLFKVRTRDCLDGPAADRMRRRALEAGFAGAFRFRGAKR
jgi:hypothetical protein